MGQVWMWSGALTDGGARVNAKVTGSSTRLAVADNPAMSSPLFFGAPETPDAEGIVRFTVTGLDPDTQYYYAVEDDTVLDTSAVGEFKTVVTPGTPYNFRAAFGGCAGLNTNYPGHAGSLVPGRISDHPVFDEILAADPLFFMHMGDMWYYNLGSDDFGVVGGASLENVRRAYDDVLTKTRQGGVYRRVPLVYSWDDHCYGPNNADGTFPDKPNVAQVYRENVPHYPLAEASGPIYHSFTVGRVLFIVTDNRYNRDAPTDPAPRAYLGAGQKTWMENVLATSQAAHAVVVTGQPPSSNGSASWGSYPEDRDDMLSMIGDLGWLGRATVIASDQHQLAMDSGPSIGVPLYVFGALDSSSDGPTGRWDLGVRSGRPHFGTIDFIDDGCDVWIDAKGWIGE